MRPAVLALSQGGLETARRIRAALPDAEILGLAGRVDGGDDSFTDAPATIARLFRDGRAVIGLCAAGILIRSVAPHLRDKREEPPVLAVSEDGGIVVPLVGSLTGANELAERIAAALGVRAAITGSGARRFGIILERLPPGWACANPGRAKSVTADMLAGAPVRLDGDLPWLAAAKLPIRDDADIVLRASVFRGAEPERGLLYRPRSVVAAILGATAGELNAALERSGVDPACIAAVVAPASRPVPENLPAGCPVRLESGGETSPAQMALAAAGAGGALLVSRNTIAVAVAPAPLDPGRIGRPRGRVAVVGLGPGAIGWMTPEAQRELAEATDIVGYSTYVDLIPAKLRPAAACHPSDNREELDRARLALRLAAEGRRVALVSSGDPGIFAMAAALLEAIESAEPEWVSVEISVAPGVSAMQAAAARAGAPLGHDFAVISLSDNLKPWEIIMRRLEAALGADMAIAIYNPVSRARPHRLGEALELVRGHRAPGTPVVLGSDVGRPGERMQIVALCELRTEMADSRTVVLIGSSATRTVRLGERDFVYTPRRYPSAETARTSARAPSR